MEEKRKRFSDNPKTAVAQEKKELPNRCRSQHAAAISQLHTYNNTNPGTAETARVHDDLMIFVVSKEHGTAFSSLSFFLLFSMPLGGVQGGKNTSCRFSCSNSLFPAETPFFIFTSFDGEKKDFIPLLLLSSGFWAFLLLV